MHHLRRRTLPFTSIVGQDDMKYSLILNAINPRIGGVLIRGEKGTAKSTAVRALADLLQEIPVAEGCPFNCDPYSPQDMCDLCFDRHQKGDIRIAKRKTPVIDLPLGATEDRVVGSLDVEKAIKEGIKALEPGILAAANQGILYIDETNLLDDHVADVLLDSAAMGVNIVEREGVSIAHPSKFILVGTMNPEEGELRPQLLDRFGLQVSVAGIEDVDQRMQIAKMADAFEANPDGFALEYKSRQDELKQRISMAKGILPKVRLSDDLLHTIASTCIDLGVKTHRAEIVISRTAKTIAAFEGRIDVIQEDVKKAMELALAHRMRSRPFEPPTLNKERLENSISQHEHEHKHQHQSRQHQQKQEQHLKEPKEMQNGDQSRGAQPREQVFEIGSPIDVRAMVMPRKRDRIARRKTGGRRLNTLALRNRGRYLRHRMPQEGKDIAIDATIRAAAPYQKARFGPHAIKVKSEDLREKERVGKTSSVVLFVVDASGSMGAMQRMQSAKGAVLSLLTDSYQKRDKIGMVAFKGQEAQLLLPPCSSVDLALSCLQELPTGGKSPLSMGLSRAFQLLQGELRRDAETKPIMVLISDGRANVGMGGKIRDELMEISEKTKQMGVHTIVIDTEVVNPSFMEMRLGYCKDIAEAAGGRYYSMSSLNQEVLYNVVDVEQHSLLENNT